MGEKEKRKVEKHVAQSWRYLRNSSRFIDSGDSEKASEFLWGSMAQALKALSLSRGIPLKTHRDLWDFAEVLPKELGDKSIYDAFLHANYLHTNFYESELQLKDVRRMAEDIRVAVGRLISLIPQEEPATGS